jgi:CheY-like chemotaxis protein
MPEMDGLEATRLIRREQADKEHLADKEHRAATTQPGATPQPAAMSQPDTTTQPFIIAMTANVMQGDRERCLEAGMSGYLGKPIHFNELAEAIIHCKTGETALNGAARVSFSSRPPLPVEILDPAAWSRLHAMLGAKAGEMLPVLIDTFLQEAVQLQEDAARAIQQEKPEDLRRAAHTLKSNAANFGATAMAAACLELENLGRNKSIGGAVDLLARIEKEFELAKAALLEARRAG